MGEEKDVLEIVRQYAYNINPRLAISEEDDEYVLCYVESKESFDVMVPQIQVLIKSNLERITGFLIGYNYLKSKIPF